ncbi:MAG TPA: hypothetical protein PK306_21830 [Aquabacterium sp.]|nr:hypothetical protein [Aquabacterium sp.]HQC98344.1 hypothetical protein [Aquabacterium sp.]
MTDPASPSQPWRRHGHPTGRLPRRRWLHASLAGMAALCAMPGLRAATAHPRHAGDPATPADRTTMLDDSQLDTDPPRLDAVPALPAAPAPGRPGDFDFLDGRWRIHHLKRRGAAWDRFDGTARCWSILDGAGSVEELRIPARNFHGLGLRLLDVSQQLWNDHWVNAASGVLAVPGLQGGFVDGTGLFPSVDEAQGRTTHSMGIWDRIAPGQCRWRQVFSTDGGQTWQHDWVMHWRRQD